MGHRDEDCVLVRFTGSLNLHAIMITLTLAQNEYTDTCEIANLRQRQRQIIVRGMQQRLFHTRHPGQVFVGHGVGAAPSHSSKQRVCSDARW